MEEPMSAFLHGLVRKEKAVLEIGESEARTEGTLPKNRHIKYTGYINLSGSNADIFANSDKRDGRCVAS
jgi:hypothetical protein